MQILMQEIRERTRDAALLTTLSIGGTSLLAQTTGQVGGPDQGCPAGLLAMTDVPCDLRSSIR